jgi:hypothetical protein
MGPHGALKGWEMSGMRGNIIVWFRPFYDS